MGDFTQNLLKLTEFPFSYSLIGLFALIAGQGTNIEELSFAKVGPLFILMGFVATTLSIVDPVGALQRLLIRGRSLDWIRIKSIRQFYEVSVFRGIVTGLFSPPYILAILDTPEGIKKNYNLNWNYIRYEQFYSPKIEREFNKINEGDFQQLAQLLDRLKQQTLKTKWITAEIDRITALIYFIIIISTFIAATQVLPDFLAKFAQSFADDETTKLAILLFSIFALTLVSLMFIFRIFGLQAKAPVVFKYLTSLGAIKVSKEGFQTTLENTERYLDEAHWTLAEYWVNRIQKDYAVFYSDKLA